MIRTSDPPGNSSPPTRRSLLAEHMGAAAAEKYRRIAAWRERHDRPEPRERAYMGEEPEAAEAAEEERIVAIVRRELARQLPAAIAQVLEEAAHAR